MKFYFTNTVTREPLIETPIRGHSSIGPRINLTDWRRADGVNDSSSYNVADQAA